MEKEDMKKMQENLLKKMKFNPDEPETISPRKEK